MALHGHRDPSLGLSFIYTVPHAASLSCLAGRCGHHSPYAAHPSDRGAPREHLSGGMDLKREGEGTGMAEGRAESLGSGEQI